MPEDPMRIFGFALGAFVWILLAVVLTAQQSATPTSQSSQAVAILQRSLGLLAGGSAISDVTLTGTVRRLAGSDDETGTAVLKALATGEARMDLGLPSGQSSEVWKNSGNIQGVQAGQWTGRDGKSHAIALHNLVTDSSWFFPAMTLTRWLSIPGYAISLVGEESLNGETVEHITVSLLATTFPADMSAMFQHLSRTEIYLDSASGLPAALAFNIHPDNDAVLDIPVEIRISDYRVVNGAQVPFHVERYLNNVLFMDLHFNVVTLNTGLSAADFPIQ
jgi:hypothetical protein